MKTLNKKKKSTKVALPPIKYPTWKVSQRPTPTEKLLICDHCRVADWTIHRHGNWRHEAHHCDDHQRRPMREATPEEYDAGKVALKEIIGDHALPVK